MQVTSLEVAAVSGVTMAQTPMWFKVQGSGQEFVLAEETSAGPKGGTAALQRLRETLSRGEKVTTVTGRVEGWSGRFPVVLSALEQKSAQKSAAKAAPARLLVTDFGSD